MSSSGTPGGLTRLLTLTWAYTVSSGTPCHFSTSAAAGSVLGKNKSKHAEFVAPLYLVRLPKSFLVSTAMFIPGYLSEMSKHNAT